MKHINASGSRFYRALVLTNVLLAATIQTRGQVFQELYAFGSISTNGNSPQGALVEGNDGDFYGTCEAGGQPTTNYPAGGYGTVFKVTARGVLTTMAWFNGTNNGRYPFGGMIQATDGNFYGDSDRGLFKITPQAALTQMPGGSLGDPIQGTNGYLYSGNPDAGVIAWYSLSGSTVGFVDPPGTLSGGLIQASDGNFYGLTSDGGTYGYGTAYKLTPTGALTTLVSFGGNPIGSKPAWPYGKMLQASDGNLYGVDANGAGGQVFKLTLSGTLTAFAEFGITDQGQDPNGGLIEANDGNFYGTTSEGGNVGGGQGTVFQIAPAGHISTLFSFTYNGAVPGSGPMAGLIQGGDGNLYGACAYGGDYGGGNIFRIVMPGPQLNSSRSGQQLVISWRTNYAGYTLQSCSNLSFSTWSDVTNSATPAGGQFFVTNTLNPGAGFFRLKK